MIEIFLKTLPFFAVIGLGYWAGRTKFFSEEATAYLTKFVFYFALSAMIFRFAATLEETVVSTIEGGDMTKDLALLIGPDQAWQSTTGFLDKIDENLQKAMS